MKSLIQIIILLCCTAVATAQPGGWAVATASFQFNMTMVAQIQVNNVPNHLLNNHLAVYHKEQIRGYATPMIHVNGQAYYFLSLGSETFKGDTLFFRAYLGADDKIYESVDTVVFKHPQALGTIPSPFQIRFTLGDRPLIYSLSALNYAAGACGDVVDVEASDNQNSEGNGLSYSITGGADASRFSINPATGVLSWNNFIPDVANPMDHDMDNRYEVEVQVADAENRIDVQRITVTVVNNAAMPSLVCPPNQNYLTNSDGTGDCGAEANRTGVALPNLCASYDLTYQLTGSTTSSGSGQIPLTQSFYKGSTTATYTMSGPNPSTCSFTVIVADNEPPTAMCPSPITVSCENSFSVSYTTPGADNCSVAVQQIEGLASGSAFPYGVTTNTFEVSDGVHPNSSCSFTVTVTDAPVNNTDRNKGYCSLASALADANATTAEHITLVAGAYNGCVTVDRDVRFEALGGKVVIECLIMDGVGKTLILDSDLTVSNLTLTGGHIRTNGHNLALSQVSGGSMASYIVTD